MILFLHKNGQRLWLIGSGKLILSLVVCFMIAVNHIRLLIIFVLMVR